MKMEFFGQLGIISRVVLAVAALSVVACAPQGWDVGPADPVASRSDDDGGMGGGMGGGSGGDY